jgi:hypothetical protein
LTLVANSSRLPRTEEIPFAGHPSLPRLWRDDPYREFATSVIVGLGPIRMIDDP